MKAKTIALLSIAVSFLFFYTLFKITHNTNYYLFFTLWVITSIILLASFNYIKYGIVNPFPIKEDSNINRFYKVIESFEQKGIISIPLENISQLWTDEENKVIKINMDKVYSIWRDDYVITIHDNPDTVFKHKEISAFYKKIQDVFKEQLIANKKIYLDNKDVTQEEQQEQQEFSMMYRTILFLLRNLDQNGHCPSVVEKNRNGMFRSSEPDYQKTNKKQNDIKSDYELLALSVNLLQHSIHVAENIIKIMQKQKELYSKVMLPSAVIVALAHDIGKEPELYNSAKYSTMVHPEISAEFVKRFFNSNVFKDISGLYEKKINAIIFAIENHHIKTVESKDVDPNAIKLFKLLKQADAEARKEEKKDALVKLNMSPDDDDKQKKDVDKAIEKANDLESLLKEVKENNQKVVEQQKKSQPKQQIEKQPVVNENENVSQPLIFQYPDFESALLFKPKDVNEQVEQVKSDYICEWINDNNILDEMINIIDERVNYVVYNGNTPIYNIFTVRDTIFLTAKVVPSLLYYFARRLNDEVVMNADKTMRRSLSIQLVGKFRNMGIVNTNQVKEGYLGGRFTLEIKKYNQPDIEQKGAFLLPFDIYKFAEMNGKSITDYEERKSDKRYDEKGFLKTIVNYKWRIKSED